MSLINQQEYQFLLDQIVSQALTQGYTRGSSTGRTATILANGRDGSNKVFSVVVSATQPVNAAEGQLWFCDNAQNPYYGQLLANSGGNYAQRLTGSSLVKLGKMWAHYVCLVASQAPT